MSYGRETYCSECKQSLGTWARGDKTTCSPKCRKRRERRQKEAHAAYILALHELGKMRESIKRRENLEDFRAQLHRLKGEINDLLLLAGDEEQMAKQQMFADRARRTVG